MPGAKRRRLAGGSSAATPAGKEDGARDARRAVKSAAAKQKPAQSPSSPKQKKPKPPPVEEEEDEDEDEDARSDMMVGTVGIDQSRTKLKPSNKQKTLVFASRGISRQERHFLMDLRSLLPHHKAESKLDEKKKLADTIPELCALRGCNSTVFFENRKRKDLYMYLSQVPDGPTAKFLVSNVHTMDELKMPGNCLKGSRPLLHFDKSFTELPELQVLRALFTQTFGTPRHHPNSKPFIDHVFSFYYVKGRVWFRNYQIVEEKVPGTKQIDRSLLEIGPRFVMQPIRVWNGSFEGRCVWHNKDYVTPNRLRADAKNQAREYLERKRATRKREAYMSGKAALPDKSPVDKVFR
eukprot:Hpha_TRINITY_DN16614_c1_g1::TRINITY_DN16614_c1_g1_i26::g.180757::m.180757/K14820/BRX1, BRIX1; ribosome biogenesis protein BRX1